MSNKKQFYKSLWTLVIPITIQNLITNAVNAADVFMIGLVGQDELSAISLANQMSFLLVGFFFGINSGITIMVAQYWGKRDTDTIQKIAGIALKFSMAVTGLITLGCLFVPSQIMHIYTPDTNLINIGASYLRIIAVTFFLSGFSQVMEATLRSVEKAKESTIISTVALVLNVTLNAVFIFGLLGVPKLGVTGIAIATLVSRIVEVILCSVYYFKGAICEPDLKMLLGNDKVLSGDFVKYSLPALINDCAWTVAFSLYSVILGHLNSDIVAANSVATTVRDLISIVGFAISSGASVLLGIEIGRGETELVKEDAKRSVNVTLICGAITAIVIILVRPLIFNIYELSPLATDYLNIMMLISSYYVVGQFYNTLMIAGIFRAGGESKWGMICDIIVMWGISVPLGFISAFVLKLPPMWVYFILCLDEFWKIPVVIKHYKSYKWINDITR